MSMNVPQPRPQDAAGSSGTVATLPGSGRETAPGMEMVQPTRSLWRRGLEVFAENRLALTGAVILVAVLAFCFLGPLVYHTDQVHTDLALANLPPGHGHPLGTDPDGYDELGRLMAGGQVSLELGIAAAIVATVIGTLWGAIAGYFGGVLDTVMMRVVDAALAIPVLFLLIVLATIIRPTKLSMILIISLASWLAVSRLVRGEALSLRVREYVQAAKAMGVGSGRIVVRHIMPNTVGTVMVNATFQVADAILFIAYISFLGLGLSPPSTDLGGMLSSGVNYVNTGYWWLIYPAGFMIVIIVIAVNFIGDALRDAFEVRLQRR
jgi:peptide/nickel transport system permease protein